MSDVFGCSLETLLETLDDVPDGAEWGLYRVIGFPRTVPAAPPQVVDVWLEPQGERWLQSKEARTLDPEGLKGATLAPYANVPLGYLFDAARRHFSGTRVLVIVGLFWKIRDGEVFCHLLTEGVSAFLGDVRDKVNDLLGGPTTLRPNGWRIPSSNAL